MSIACWIPKTTNMAHAHCMLDTDDYKYAFRICNTYCSSTTTMVARTRLNVTLYVCLLFSLLSQHCRFSSNEGHPVMDLRYFLHSAAWYCFISLEPQRQNALRFSLRHDRLLIAPVCSSTALYRYCSYGPLWPVVGWTSLYRVIHKSLRDFRTRLRNNQDRYSSERSPTRCNNCVFILLNGFTLHVSGDNLTHDQEYICCIWPQVSRLT